MAQHWNSRDSTGVLDPGWNGSGFDDALAESYWLELPELLTSIALAEIHAGNVPTQILRNHQRGIILLAFDRGPLVQPPAFGVIVHTSFRNGNYCYDGTKCTYEGSAQGSFLAFDDPLWAPEE